MEYNFKEIEAKWQSRWRADKTYKVERDGPLAAQILRAGHVPPPFGSRPARRPSAGHIASDIYRATSGSKGFNVLHPMGYDAFGLPAEQYAIQTGSIPPSRPSRTSPATANSWTRSDSRSTGTARCARATPILQVDAVGVPRDVLPLVRPFETAGAPVAELTAAFETGGTEGLDAPARPRCTSRPPNGTPKSEREKEQILQNYRLAFRADTHGQLVSEAGGPCWPTTKCTTDFRVAAAIRSSRSA